MLKVGQPCTREWPIRGSGYKSYIKFGFCAAELPTPTSLLWRWRRRRHVKSPARPTSNSPASQALRPRGGQAEPRHGPTNVKGQSLNSWGKNVGRGPSIKSTATAHRFPKFHGIGEKATGAFFLLFFVWSQTAYVRRKNVSHT